jgi:small subunit ribosomal protein S7
MARRRKAEKRMVDPDPRFNSVLVSKMINNVMERGKKSTAAGIVYGALTTIAAKTGDDALEIFERALENVKPKLEVKSRRVGGATYQVPMEVSRDRQVALAMRWLISFSQKRKGVKMEDALGNELLEAYKGQGAAVKRRDEMHRMAQANKAFAHYRW